MVNAVSRDFKRYCAMTTVRGVPPFFPSGTGAERQASGAANGRSEARAEAIGGRLQANVRRGKCSRIRVPIWSLTLPAPNILGNIFMHVFMHVAVEQSGRPTTGIRDDHSLRANRSKTSRWLLPLVNPRRAILVRHGLRTEALWCGPA